MRKVLRLVLVLSCISCWSGWGVCKAASTNQTPVTVGVPKTAEWRVSPSADGRRISFIIACDGVSLVPVEGGLSVRIPGQAASAKPGTPDVPHLSKLMPGVKGARASLTVHGYDPTNFLNVVVAPVQGYRLDETVGRIRTLKPYRQADPDVYGKDQFWPVTLGTLEEGAIGTQRVVRVACFPVQYNSVQGVVRLFRRLEGEIRFETK